MKGRISAAPRCLRPSSRSGHSGTSSTAGFCQIQPTRSWSPGCAGGGRQRPPYSSCSYSARSPGGGHTGVGFESLPLMPGLLAALRQGAARDGAALRVASDEGSRAALAAVVGMAEDVERSDSAYARELTVWTPPPGSMRLDGVPPSSYPARPKRTNPIFPGRDFAHGEGRGLPASSPAAATRYTGVAGERTAGRVRRLPGSALWSAAPHPAGARSGSASPHRRSLPTSGLCTWLCQVVASVVEATAPTPLAARPSMIRIALPVQFGPIADAAAIW